MTKLWAIAAAAVLAGCGRDGSPEYARGPAKNAVLAEPPPAGADAQARDPRPVVVCFGDSLTAGLGLDPGQSYPDVLQQEMSRSGYEYRVVNLGVSGETSQDGLARVPQALGEKPRVAVVEFGANDGLRGVPVAVTEGNLAEIIQDFQNAGVKVVLAGMTLPPNYGPVYIRSFEAMYRELAAKYRVALIPFLLENVAGDGRLMQHDGLHPNAEGTRHVAATVFRAVAPGLKAH
jgi:acyl-CoA thioesterase I